MATNPSSHPIYSGEFRHNIDDKNRITIPSEWRKENADSFFLVPNHKLECLTVMPPDVFREIGEKSESKVPQAQYRTFMRHFYAQARQVSIDKQGRLLLPDDYCKRVSLQGDVMLAGSSDRFEIWNPANWEKFRDAAKATYAEVAELVGL